MNFNLPSLRFTWNIVYACNYRCSYCFFDGKWEEYAKRNIYLSTDEWFYYWKRIYDKYGKFVLIITGGEPFIYPDFIEIIKRLSKICYHINISSNSSGDLERFIETISPENVSLSLSFQPEFEDLKNFIKKVVLIRKYKFDGCINFVAYPPFFEKIDEYKKEFFNLKEELKIIPFWGEYNNKKYPESYTEEEKNFLGIDDSWFKKVKRKGNECLAGYKTALLFPDGKVARCGQIGERYILGNFFDKNFNLLNKPMNCDAEYCPCEEDKIL